MSHDEPGEQSGTCQSVLFPLSSYTAFTRGFTNGGPNVFFLFFSPDCNMVNLLSQNQQASWTDTHVSTCCVGTLQSTCFLRIQTDVQGSDKCIIPNCDDLQSNDADKMVGFKPLTSTWAKGAHSNEYYFKTSAAAPNFHTVSMTMLASTAAVVALAMAGNAIFA